ncbi:MAG: hypothetical protein JSW48_01955, partial [Betaproteobacteria bacterium]
NRGAKEFEYLPPTQQKDVLAAYDLRQTLSIRPAAETVRGLQRHRLLFRQDAGGFAVYTSVTDDVMDFPLAGNQLFRFHLVASSPGFSDVSNVGFGGAERQINLFTTEAANEDAEGLHLSRPLAAFTSERNYAVGAQVVDSADDATRRFTAVMDVGKGSDRRSTEWLATPALPPKLTAAVANNIATGDRARKEGIVYEAQVNSPGVDVSDATQWQRLFAPGIQAANEADQKTLCGRFLNVDVSSASPVFVAHDVADRAGRIVASGEMSGAPQNPLKTVHVDLGEHSIGLHRITLRNAAGRLLRQSGQVLAQADQEIYVDAEAIALNAFAVVEIQSDSIGYELLKADKTVASPTFLLRIPSRPTFWSYTFPKPLTAAEQGQIGAEFQPVGGSPDRIITRDARALDRGFVKLQRLNTGKLLPNPTEQTGIAVERSTGRLISPIYLTHKT